MPQPSPAPDTELYVPHIGWLRHEPADEVAVFLNQGWYEYREQAFCWLFLREGDCFLDVGAHFGLYSALAGCAGVARVIAVEPNQAALPHLHANIVRHEARAACVVPHAVSARDGKADFYPCAGARAAYSSLFAEEPAAAALRLETLTLESLCRRYNVDRIALAKVDVEGSELDLLAGASAVLGRISCLIIECTELNLRRAGRNTESLFQALAGAGFQVCGLDEERLLLAPRPYEGAIGYDNLIAARDPDAINNRLRAPAAGRFRIAREIVARGSASAALRRRLEEIQGQVQEARAAADQARSDASRAAGQLEALLSSRFVRLGLSAGVLHDPRRAC